MKYILAWWGRGGEHSSIKDSAYYWKTSPKADSNSLLCLELLGGILKAF